MISLPPVLCMRTKLSVFLYPAAAVLLKMIYIYFCCTMGAAKATLVAARGATMHQLEVPAVRLLSMQEKV